MKGTTAALQSAKCHCQKLTSHWQQDAAVALPHSTKGHKMCHSPADVTEDPMVNYITDLETTQSFTLLAKVK
jgi:hypothetical protein